MAILGKKKNKEESESPIRTGDKPRTADISGSGDAYKILVKPLVSEKTYKLGERGKYVFKVSRQANKISVRNAVEKIYGVKVVKVNVVTAKGKPKNFGRISSKTSDWKKAVVTLKKGEAIQGLER